MIQFTIDWSGFWLIIVLFVISGAAYRIGYWLADAAYAALKRRRKPYTVGDTDRAWPR